MPGGESTIHLNLKRLAIGWAQTQGFHIAAPEVSAPSLGGCRLDAAAYRPEHGPGSKKVERLGVTAIFECKQARADFLRDSRSREAILERLRKLHERKLVYEESMKLYYPTLRNGDCLFPDLDSYRFESSDYEPYNNLVAEIATLSRRLHAQTKFARLLQWRAANLHYVVAEPDVAQPHELPVGWGLLIRREGALELAVPAVWQDASEEQRWALLLRIAISGTKTGSLWLEERCGVGKSEARTTNAVETRNQNDE